jgi:hypothetical protein
MEAEVGALVEYAVNAATDSVYLRLGVGEVADPIRISLASQGRDRRKGGSSATGTMRSASATVRGSWPAAFEAVEEIEKSTGASIRLVNLPG